MQAQAGADGDQDVRAGIPPELVWRNNYETFTQELDDPYVAVSRLETQPPVIWVTNMGRGESAWLVTSHAVIAEAMMDYEHFSTERPGVAADLLGVDLKLIPVDIDPSAHHAYRMILQPLFTPHAMNALRDAVREHCTALIAKFADQGGCEFAHEFAFQFPAYVFLDLMGLPREKLPEFLAWEKDFMLGATVEARKAAARGIYDYLETFLEEQRRAPTSAMVRAVLEGRYEGRPLDHLETMGMLYILYIGGLDTVASTLGWVIRHLATHDDLQERLRADPKLIPAAVEEFFRAFGVAHTFRTVTQDFVFHGAPLRKGDHLHLPTTLASRDSRVYANPHVIDLDRKARHLSFGAGVHVCLGAHLARREICIVIEEFLARFRNIRIREGETYKYNTRGNFQISYLPLRWDLA